MDMLFFIISFLSVPIMFYFMVRMLISKIKKDDGNGKKFKKYSLISIGVMLVSMIISIALTDPVETKVVKKEGSKKVEVAAVEKQEVEKEPKLTDEEKTELEKKEAEEKAATEAKVKKEAESKALAVANRKKGEAARKAKEEADAIALAEQIAKEKADKKVNAQTIPYAQLKKNPDRYAGEYVKYTGEIMQILEGNGMTNIRLAVTKDSYGYDFNDLVFIEYTGYTDFVDGDIVTIYGEVYGAYSYESQAGYNISLPGIVAEEVTQ